METVVAPEIPDEVISCLKGEYLSPELLPLEQRAAFCCLYGPPNTGKSLQMELLEEWLITNGISYLRLKFPLYTLMPTGPIIERALKKKQPYIDMDATELQKLTAQNRMDFQPTIIRLLNSGTTIIAEDYTLTGMGVGLFTGADMSSVVAANRFLIAPDKAIILSGRRFEKGIEPDHIMERGRERWHASKRLHYLFAEKLGYPVIDNHGSIEDVAAQVWAQFSPYIRLTET
jgi:thymidylate kinase